MEVLCTTEDGSFQDVQGEVTRINADIKGNEQTDDLRRIWNDP